LGHADRRVGLMDSCRGLMRPIKRKSITSLNPKRLTYPKISFLAAAGKVQRPVPDSIASLQQLIAVRQSQGNSCDVHAVE